MADEKKAEPDIKADQDRAPIIIHPKNRPFDPRISDADRLFNEIVDCGGIEPVKMIKIERSELTPSAAENPLFKVKDAAGDDLPVYVVPKLGHTQADAPRAAILTDEHHQQRLIINEGYHQWTDGYVREHILPSDKDINATPQMSLERFNDILQSSKDNKWKTAEGLLLTLDDAHLARSAKIVAALHSMADAEHMGVNNLHTIIAAMPKQELGASESSEGTPYITLRKPTLQMALESDKATDAFISALGHEVAHIRNGDVSAAGLVRNRDAAENRKSEWLADFTGEGPSASHNPAGLKDFLLDAALLPNIPGKVTPDSLKQTSDALARYVDVMHPPILDRAAAQDMESALMADYEKRNAVADRASRQAEETWVVSRLSEKLGMNDLPDRLKAQLQEMAALPMAETHNVVPQAQLPGPGAKSAGLNKE